MPLDFTISRAAWKLDLYLRAPPSPDNCMRVLIRSMGCTTHVAPMPAKPLLRNFIHWESFFCEVLAILLQCRLGRLGTTDATLADFGPPGLKFRELSDEVVAANGRMV